MLWEGGTQETVRERILQKGDPTDAKRFGSYTRSLLSLRVLVQNRRKDKQKVLILGAQTQAISYEDVVELVMKGKREGDRIFDFTSARYVASTALEQNPSPPTTFRCVLQSSLFFYLVFTSVAPSLRCSFLKIHGTRNRDWLSSTSMVQT